MNKNTIGYKNKIKYIQKYKKENMKKYTFYVNMNTEAEILDKLSTVQYPATYIKELILLDINKKKG